MKYASSHPKTRLKPLGAISVAVLALLHASAHGSEPLPVTSSWTCGNGNWNASACWSAGIPLSGDTAEFSPASSISVTWSNPLFIGVVLNRLLISSATNNAQTELLQSGPGVLASQVELIGNYGDVSGGVGLHTQTLGTNNTGSLFVGSGLSNINGRYVMSGAQNPVLNVADTLTLGGAGSASSASFEQGAGIVTAAHLLFEPGQGSTATYTLSGGSLVTQDVRAFGDSQSTSTFVQSGGRHSTGTLQLDAFSGGAGVAYTLNGGRLDFNAITFGTGSGASNGSFTWKGGTLYVTHASTIGDGSFFLEQAGSFAVGSGRTFGASDLTVLSGATLSHAGGGVLVDAGNTFSNQGTHLIDGGRFTVNGNAVNLGITTLAGGTIDGSGQLTNANLMQGHGQVNGTLALSNQGNLIVSGGTLTLAATGGMHNDGAITFASLADQLEVNADLSNAGAITLAGQSIKGGGTLTNEAAGVISGWGRIGNAVNNSGTLVATGALTLVKGVANDGVITLDSAASRLGGGLVANGGTLQGHGTVSAAVANAGTLEAMGGTLVLSGSAGNTNAFAGRISLTTGNKVLYTAGLAANAGRIELSGGTFDNNGQALANAGVVTGHGIVRAASLTNSGQIQLSGGATQIQADFTNQSGGKAIVSGDANVTFSGSAEFQGAGEFRVSDGATATFFGKVVERNGAIFSGTGSKHYEGGLSVGASPGLAHETGSITFGSGNNYIAELAGLAPGTQFDKYIVDGALTFGGTLTLTELNGYQAKAGDRFDLFDWGSTSGRFAGIDTRGAALGHGLAWDFSRLYTTGEVSVSAVPEPSSSWLLLAGLATLTAGTFRRQRGAHLRSEALK